MFQILKGLHSLGITGKVEFPSAFGGSYPMLHELRGDFPEILEMTSVKIVLP